MTDIRRLSDQYISERKKRKSIFHFPLFLCSYCNKDDVIVLFVIC